MPSVKSGITILKFGARALKGGAKVGERAVAGTVHNGKNVLFLSAAGWGAMHVVKGEGITEPVMEGLFGEEAANKGAVHCLNRTLFGKDDQDNSLVENTVDFVGGKGTYNQAADFVSNTVEKGREYIGDAKEQGREMLQSAVASDTQMTVPSQGQTVLYDSNGNPHVITQPDVPPQQIQQISQMSPFSGVDNFVASVTGGKISAFNMLEIIAAAYMMFGNRFGWIGKIGGALIGGSAAKEISARAAQQQAMAQSGPILPVSYYQPAFGRSYIQEQEQTQTVTRSRGL